MRIAFAILSLTTIALALVMCRHAEVATQRDIHRLQGRLVQQRRQLWDLDVTLAQLTSVQALQVRAEDMRLRLLQPHDRLDLGWSDTYATRPSPGDPQAWPRQHERGDGGAH